MCQVIAEISWNHGGDMNLAEKMIQEAAKSGADYAKFQSWSVKNLKPGPWDTDGRRQIYEKAELSEESHRYLMDVCLSNKIQFLTSAFCEEDAEKIANLWCKKVKIPSPEITNLPLLIHVNKNFEEVFLSCGAATYKEIKEALDILRKPKVVLLHCVSSYPCPFDKVNLPRISRLKETFRNKYIGFGYSGHAPGVHDAIAALEYNIEIIEKHFTIDNDLPGRDNKFAILPHELKYLTDYIKNRWEMRLGSLDQYDSCEEEVRNVYRGRWQS